MVKMNRREFIRTGSAGAFVIAAGAAAPWVAQRGGVYDLGGDYWRKSGNVLAPLPHYEEAFA